MQFQCVRWDNNPELERFWILHVTLWSHSDFSAIHFRRWRRRIGKRESNSLRGKTSRSTRMAVSVLHLPTPLIINNAPFLRLCERPGKWTWVLKVRSQSSQSFLSYSAKMTATCGWTPSDLIPSCVSFSFSNNFFLLFFVVFLFSVFFSSATNGLLFFLLMRYKVQLWQPPYILTKYMSACGVGLTSLTGLFVLSSVVQKHGPTFGCWCITQFCLMRGFFLTSQMTLALMAVERYIFICHGIHYLRIVTKCNIHICMGLVWLISGALSLHGGLVLSQHKCGFQQQTGGLLCDAFTIKEHIAFSWKEGMQLFGSPSVIGVSCIVAICCSYGCMYRAALRATVVLKRNNHRANRTVGFYLLMFLLQLTLNMCFVILTMMDSSKIPYCKEIGFIVTPLLIILPSGIIAVYLLIRNPQIRQLLFKATLQPPPPVQVEQSGMDVTIRDMCQVEHRRHVELEVVETEFLPLPGCVCPSDPEEENQTAVWCLCGRQEYVDHIHTGDQYKPTQPYGHNSDTFLTDILLTFYVLCISINHLVWNQLWCDLSVLHVLVNSL